MNWVAAFALMDGIAYSGRPSRRLAGAFRWCSASKPYEAYAMGSTSGFTRSATRLAAMSRTFEAAVRGLPEA